MIATLLAALAADDTPASPLSEPEPAGFAHFRDFCLDHAGKPDESLKAAEGAGWMPVPRKMAPVPPPEIIEAKIRIRSDDTAHYSLMAGRAALMTGGFTWDSAICEVSVWPADADATIAALERWVSLPPGAMQDGARFYAFAEQGGQRRPVDPSAAPTVRLLQAGAVWLVAVRPAGDGVAISLAIPQRVTEDLDPTKRQEQMTRLEPGMIVR